MQEKLVNEFIPLTLDQNAQELWLLISTWPVPLWPLPLSPPTYVSLAHPYPHPRPSLSPLTELSLKEGFLS